MITSTVIMTYFTHNGYFYWNIKRSSISDLYPYLWLCFYSLMGDHNGEASQLQEKTFQCQQRTERK